MELVQIEEIAVLQFSTRDPVTGNAADAVINSVTVCEEATLTDLAGTDIQVSVHGPRTGQYVAYVTTANAVGFAKGAKYSVRVNATVNGVTDEAVIGAFRISGENHGNVIDTILSTGFSAVPSGVWAHTDTVGSTKTAFEIIAMAAAGAGAGTCDVGVAPGTTRNETFRYLNGFDAFISTADEQGNRTNVNLNP